MKELKKILDKYITEKRIAGAGCIFRYKGKIIFEYYNGFSDIEKQIRLNNRTIYRLASMTKPIISLGVMKLIEMNKLKLDDELLMYLPDFKEMWTMKNGFYIKCSEPIKIGNLLNHSSGIGSGVNSLSEIEDILSRGQDLDKSIKEFSSVPLEFEPGSKSSYSPLGAYEVLGKVIEIVSGTNTNAFLHENIFYPLGIKDIVFYLDNIQKESVSKLYEYANNELIDVSHSNDLWNMTHSSNQDFFSASAGLYGTLKDYDKISELFLGEGNLKGEQIIGKDSCNLMLKNFIHDTEMFGMYWGQGLLVTSNNKKNDRKVPNQTFGWSGAFGTHFIVNKEIGMTFTLMVQSANCGGSDSQLIKDLEGTIFNILAKETTSICI